MKQVKIFGVLLLILASAGCSSLVKSRSFLNPDADFGFYKKVGLLGFGNQSEDRIAGEKVTEHFMTELLIRGDMEVMDTGQFNFVVAQATGTRGAIDTQELSRSQLSKIAEVAGVQGIFMGTVHEYKMLQLGGEQYPVISMTVKFIDASAGTVVWQNNIHARGGPNLPIVSIGETFTLGNLTQEICRKVVQDFYDKAFQK
jgi:hypothetical protein